MKDFRKLDVWSKAHALTLATYAATRRFPSDERYGVTSQVRRASTSIPTNLAEGCGRGSDADFARFVQIAMGSASEVEYLILLAHDLEYREDDAAHDIQERVVEIKRMLAGLLRRLRSTSDR